MQIPLTQTTPQQDGYYLVRFHESGGLHLVLLQTDLGGQRSIIPDICPFKASKDKKVLNCLAKGSPLFFNEFPSECWWSELIETV